MAVLIKTTETKKIIAKGLSVDKGELFVDGVVTDIDEFLSVFEGSSFEMTITEKNEEVSDL